MAMAMPRLKTLSRHLATGSKRFAGDARWRCASSSSSGSPTWSLDGIEYRRLEPGHDPEALFQFNKEHGSTPLNFIPDGPVREHFGRLATGETTVWAAFSGDEMAGFITGELGGGYWLQTEPGQDASLDNDGTTCFINEFVVNPKFRRKRIGVRLTTASVDPEMGIWASNPAVTSMYTTVHVDNIASRTAFIKGGYSEAVTYTDQDRDRNTTVLKKAAPGAEIATAQRGNSRTMRVIGVQSGNAVDGIDVGIFDFEPVDRSPADPRALNKSLEYTMVANKTFPFTPEQRQYVLGLRAMNRVDGNDYAEGNYAMGEWCASAINGLLDESGIDRSSCALIGSHGQTVSGHPHWEFGDLSVIAQQTCITVAGDFRPADVAAGGNGTPCTCTYDSIMLRPEAGREKWRVAINIGGTSSVTFCPPWPTAEQAAQPDMAGLVPGGMDPGLGVFFMDLCTQEIDPSLDFDDNGDIARSGTVNNDLLQIFLQNKYYAADRTLPIGVGPDDFPETLFHDWHAKAQEMGVSDVDMLTTLVELTATQIARACSRFGGPNIANGATDDVLLRGGVVFNTFFVERLRAQMSIELQTEVPRISTLGDVGIDEESWENAMYAMFGYLCYNNIYNFVPSCTGASRPVVGGRIAPGENFHSVRLLNQE